jgi:Zn-finger nucleic acid-binding protein
MFTHPKCPRCRETELTPAQAGGTMLDRCGQCRGLWFDARGDELRKVLERGWERVPEALRQAGPGTDPSRDTPADLFKLQPLLCPRCGSDMISYWYGGETARTFVADACPLGHGVWLDSGELEKAFRALEQFSQTRAEMERSGKVDEALARGESGDWGPKSVFSNPFWEYLAEFLNTKIHYPGRF